jgi:hypothetical protein
MVPDDRYGGRVEEARMEDTKYGRGPVTDGWFVVNVRDAAWMRNTKFGDACIIETDEVSFPQIGYTIAVLGEGGSSGLYHREDDQEDFLVLSGECIAIVEGRERRLRAGTYHPRNEVALRHGVGVEQDTGTAREAYAPFPDFEPGPPESFDGLPFG